MTRDLPIGICTNWLQILPEGSPDGATQSFSQTHKACVTTSKIYSKANSQATAVTHWTKARWMHTHMAAADDINNNDIKITLSIITVYLQFIYLIHTMPQTSELVNPSPCLDVGIVSGPDCSHTGWLIACVALCTVLKIWIWSSRTIDTNVPCAGTMPMRQRRWQFTFLFIGMFDCPAIVDFTSLQRFRQS